MTAFFHFHHHYKAETVHYSSLRTRSSPAWPVTPSDTLLLRTSSQREQNCHCVIKDITFLLSSRMSRGRRKSARWGAALVWVSKTALCLRESKWNARIMIYILGPLIRHLELPRRSVFMQDLLDCLGVFLVICVNRWQVVGVSDWEVSLSIRHDSLNLSHSGWKHCRKTLQDHEYYQKHQK